MFKTYAKKIYMCVCVYRERERMRDRSVGGREEAGEEGRKRGSMGERRGNLRHTSLSMDKEN